jgi:hypothetical protein
MVLKIFLLTKGAENTNALMNGDIVTSNLQNGVGCGFVPQNNPRSDFDMADSGCSNEKIE